MNILHEVVKEGIPLPEHLLLQLRNEHARLTRQVDDIEKTAAKISFFSRKGLIKSVQLNFDAQDIERRSEKLRYQIQTKSDIARSLRMPGGQLTMLRVNSRLSLVSIQSICQHEVEGAMELAVIPGQPAEAQHAQGDAATHNQTIATNTLASITNTLEHKTADSTLTAAGEVQNERVAHLQSIQEEETSVLHSGTTTSADAPSNVDMTSTVEQQIQDANLTMEEGESNDSESFCIDGQEITEIVVDVEPNPWRD